MDELLISGGTLIDGSGATRKQADVLINNGRISGIFAPGSALTAHRVIDAEGLIVAPGFVDMHAHSDFTLPLNPHAESKVRQGVTTEVVGNCGFSVAPVLPGKAGLLKDYLAHSAPWLPFKDVSFRDYVDSYPATSVNVVHQVGHNTLRLMVMGMENRHATDDELKKMKSLLAEALDAGALGMSSGVFTAPGAYAPSHELVDLALVLAQHGARYSAHVRDEGPKVFEAIQEAIDLARCTGVHTQISHLKVAGMDNWGNAPRLLSLIEQARREGVPIDCDQHPYDSGSFPLRNLLPTWVHEGGLSAMLERLHQEDVRSRLREDIEKNGLVNTGRLESWDAVRVSISPNHPELAGRSLGEIARERRREAFDQVCDCIIADRGHMRIVLKSLSQEDVDAITSTPWVLVGSDGNALAIHGVTSQGKPHPRFYGTHARVLGECVRGRGLLTLEQAIHKMTGGSAQALGWTDRGLLRERYAADIAIFDPDRVADKATIEDPHQYAIGISTVIVNGVVTIDEGEHTGALPGQVLRRARTPMQPGHTH